MPHERVMDGPVQDRLRAAARDPARTCRPSTARSPARASRLADAAEDRGRDPRPLRRHDDRGVLHRMWPIAADAADRGLGGRRRAPDRGRPSPLHHRAALPRRTPIASMAPVPGTRVLTLVVDAAAEQLPVLPFHRVQLAGSMPASPVGDGWPDLATALAACSDDDAGRQRPSDATATDPCATTTLPSPGKPPAVRALHAELLDGRVPRRLAPVRPRCHRRPTKPCGPARPWAPTSAAHDPRPDPFRDRTRGAPAGEVDLFLAQATHRHGHDAAGRADRSWCVDPEAAPAS